MEKTDSEQHLLDQSPENSYLRNLVRYMNVLVQNVASPLKIKGKQGLVHKLERLVKSSPLPEKVRNKIRQFHLKVQKDICPKCKKEREVIVHGTCSRKGKEYLKGIKGFKCSDCGDLKKVETVDKPVNNLLNLWI